MKSWGNKTASEKARLVSEAETLPGRTQPAFDLERRVEAKAAVLLGHISLMIAVTGVLWSVVVVGELQERLVALELVAYLLLALLCIWLQSDRLPGLLVEEPKKRHEGFSVHERSALDRAFYKMRVYRFVYVALFPLTVVVVATIVAVAFNGLWFRTPMVGG